MDDDDIRIVRRSWHRLAPYVGLLGEVFYGRLLAIAPHLRPLFEATKPGDRSATFADTLATLMSGLEHEAETVSTLEKLGYRHARYGVRPEHYAPVGEALLWTFDAALRDGLTLEERRAWNRTFAFAETCMRAGHDRAAGGLSPATPRLRGDGA